MTERIWRRLFHWGALMIGDAIGPVDVPEIDDRYHTVATPSMIFVPVHHARDVDMTGFAPHDVAPWAEVDVRYLVNAPLGAADAPEFGGSVLCPSGRLTLGDAASFETFDLVPGVVDVAVRRSTIEDADTVTVWIMPRDLHAAAALIERSARAL